jgi:hypothetical protein
MTRRLAPRLVHNHLARQLHQLIRQRLVLRLLASRLGYSGWTDVLPGLRGLGGRKDGALRAFELVLLERFKTDGHTVAGEGEAAKGED